MPTEKKVRGNAFCVIAKTLARHNTTERLLNNGWWLAAVGGWRLMAVAVGGWLRLAVGCGWRLVADGGWRLVVSGSCP